MKIFDFNYCLMLEEEKKLFIFYFSALCYNRDYSHCPLACRLPERLIIFGSDRIGSPLVLIFFSLFCLV